MNGKFLGREPVLFTALFHAILAALVAFDIWDITADQLAVVEGAFAAVLGFLVRQSVTPVTKLEQQTSQDVRTELAEKNLI